jgi:hypothetical protein
MVLSRIAFSASRPEITQNALHLGHPFEPARTHCCTAKKMLDSAKPPVCYGAEKQGTEPGGAMVKAQKDGTPHMIEGICLERRERQV